MPTENEEGERGINLTPLNSTEPSVINLNEVSYDDKPPAKEIVTEKTDGSNVDSNIPSRPENFFGSRHIFAFMGFLGLVSVYMMRTNLSVAIVDMIISKPPVPNNSTTTTMNPSFFGSPRKSGGDELTCEGELAEDFGNGEFDWDSKTKGLILGSFYWGYMVTQIPGGILAERFGGKWVFAIGILLTDFFCLITPLAARSGGAGALIAVRILTGLSEGVTFPTATSMISKWVPSMERTTLGAFVLAGTQFGTVIALPLSGWLCGIEIESGWLRNGWPLAFYVPGLVGIVWFVAWFFLVYDNPSVHPRIDEDEKRYILANTGNNKYKPISATPWKTMLTSIHVWAILIAHFGHSWGFTMLLTELPTYMKGILHYDLKSNGLVSALPYLAMWLFSIGFSITADALRSHKVLTTTTTRKVFTTIGLSFPAFALIGASYTGCDRTGTLILLTLGTGFNGAVYSGFLINGIDVASNHAGSIMGITNTVGSMTGFLAPDIVGLIVTNEESLAQWQLVFFISAGIYLVCNLFYVVFGTGVEQPWNKVEQIKEEPGNHQKETI